MRPRLRTPEEAKAHTNALSLARYHALSDEQRAVLNAKARAAYARGKDKHNAKQRETRARNRDEWNAKMREYQRRNRDKYYEYNAANRFGVKRASIQAIVASSQVCEICAKGPGTRKRLAIDHCHTSGVLRGMLCHTCNLGLGAFKDNEALLVAAAHYLRRKRAQTA